MPKATNNDIIYYMDNSAGGKLGSRSRETAAEIARKKVLAAYDKKREKTYREMGETADHIVTGTYKQTPISANVTRDKANRADWQKYHSAWQNYYQKYYNDYYSKAAKSYLENERLKRTRNVEDQKRNSNGVVLESPEAPVNPTPEEESTIISDLKKTIKKHAKKQAGKSHKKLIPIFAAIIAILIVIFLQYNRLLFAPIMAYVSPGNSSDDGITALDPTITTAVGPDNRLMIPKLNVDVPVSFGISNDTATVNKAMETGVAHFMIPGASAFPGEIGNLVITGHSAGDIYSNIQYKFIFSGLERLVDGDLIYIDYQGTRYTYSVVGKETVEPSEVSKLVYETNKPMLTLVTCTPLGTSRYRLLVSAEQINPAPSGATQQDNVNEDTSNAMPKNEPTFFERIWNFLTGNN